MKKKILILGIGGHSRSCVDVIENTNLFQIAGYVAKNVKSRSYDTNLKLLGYDNDLPKIFKSIKFAHVAVGQMKNLELRKMLFLKLMKIGFQIPKIISKKSIISKNVKIGIGTIIMNNVTINSNSIIGDNCIINTGSIIEHDCKIGSHAHIGPGSILNGGVIMGEQSFIGSGSVVKQKAIINKKSFYPMMSKVV